MIERADGHGNHLSSPYIPHIHMSIGVYKSVVRARVELTCIPTPLLNTVVTDGLRLDTDISVSYEILLYAASILIYNTS